MSHISVTDPWKLAEEMAELKRENAALRNEIVRLNNQTMWVCSCGGTDCAGREENAALRSLLKESLEWLDDYGLRMSGTSDLVDRVEIALRKEEQP